MANDGEAPDSPDADAQGSIQHPVEPSAPRTDEGVSLLEELNPKWIAWFVVIAIALTAGIAIWLSLYVVIADENTERADYDQLSKAIDPLQAIATLMIGTVFGAGVQGTATAVNKRRANNNKAEAERQHGRATENAKRAKANAKVAAVQAHTAHQLRDALDMMRQHYVPPSDAEVNLFLTGSKPSGINAAPVQLDQYIDHVLADADQSLLDEKDYLQYIRG